MILDIDMQPTHIDVSYIKEDGNKAIMTLSLPPTGYTNWVYDHDGIGTPGCIGINGRPVKRIQARNFKRFDLLEYLLSLPQNIQDELFAYRKANLACSDIETGIGDRFPDPRLAEQPILMISLVDTNFDTYVYTTKRGSLERKEAVDKIVNDHIGHLLPPEKRIDTKILEYEDERTMISQYFQYVVRNASILSFWNGFGSDNSFDWPYFCQRASNLGIPLESASITNKVSTFDNTPKHTIINDYMHLVDEYASTIKNKESLSLDYMSYRVLGIGKLPKIASLKEMSENDEYLTEFLAYNVVDSVNMQLIHNRLNLLDVIYAFATLNKLPMKKAESQVAQTESMISLETLEHINKESTDGLYRVAAFTDLMPPLAVTVEQDIPLPNRKNKDYAIKAGSLLYLDYKGFTALPNPYKKAFDVISLQQCLASKTDEECESILRQHRTFYSGHRPIFGIGGGHVKDPDPRNPVKEWVACIDFSGQYPACHRSFNFSVENIIGHVDDFDITEQIRFYSDKRYLVTFMGYIYDVSKPSIYKRCQERLRAKRDEHKHYMIKHLNIIQPIIEAELFRRNLWHIEPVKPKDDAIIKFCGSLHVAVVDDIELNCDISGHEDWFIWHCFHTNLREGFYHANMQVAYKLESNSLYGATTNAYNAFGDSRLAEDTTSGGRNTIQCAEQLVNNYIAFEWHNDATIHKQLWEKFGPDAFKEQPNFGNLSQIEYRDRIAYVDTDSLYVEFAELCESIGYIGDYTEFFIEFYENYLGDIINDRLADMINSKGGDSMIKFDLEMICPIALYSKKKKYILAVSYQDGRRFNNATENLVVKGMDIKQNALSKKAKDIVGRAIDLLFNKKMTTKLEYVKFMIDAWTDFQTWSFEDIGKRMNIKKSNYEVRILSDSVAQGVTWTAGTLPQYRGAAFFNYQLDKHGLLNDIEPLHDGAVICYEDVNGNSFSFRMLEDVAFEYPEPNKLLMFYKTVVAAVDRLALPFGIVEPLQQYLGNVIDNDLEDIEA